MVQIKQHNGQRHDYNDDRNEENNFIIRNYSYFDCRLVVELIFS